MKAPGAVNKGLAEGIQLCDERLKAMSTAVGKQLARSVVMLSHMDREKASRMIRKDEQINASQIEIEELGAILLAKYNPLASDLKHILGVLYIVGNLERIGDYAVHIAKNLSYIQETKKVDNEATKKILQRFKLMLERGAEMLAKNIEAFLSHNLAMAENAIKMDQRINELNDEIFEIAIITIQEHVEKIRYFQALLSLAKRIERLGDHAAKIGRRTIYTLTGDHRLL